MRVLVGIVALLALSAVAFFVVQTLPPRVEADLQQRSTDALNAANLTFAKVTVTGRVVSLSGEAPNSAAKEQAVKVAGDVWGVSSVEDTLVVSAGGQPTEPQAIVASAAPPPPSDTPPPTAAEPPSSDSSSMLPTVGSLVDPALAPPTEPETKEEPAPAEQTAPEPAPTPAEPPPAQTAAVEPPAPAPQPATRPVTPIPEPPAATPAAPPATEPATATAPVPVQPPPSTTTPIPPAAPVSPLSKEAIAQGITEGLTAAMQSLPPAVAAAPPTYRLEAHVEGKRVELQGLVSTPSAQRALVAHVRRNIRRATVVDQLQVAHAKPDKDWLGVARTGLSQLARLDTGSLKLDGHKVAVSGKPKSERDRSRVLAAMGELPDGYTSTVLLERMQEAPPPAPVAPAVVAAAEPDDEDDDEEEEEVTPTPPPSKPQARPRRAPKKPTFVARREVREPRHVQRSISSWCRHRFNDVLPRVAVAFASGSWRLEESKGLSDLARVAQQCPDARIRLTGHSDTRETSPSATGLSYRRATTVREALMDRGVVGANITVAGRGGLRPAFSNATVDGRENNRRVEFAVW